jgi:hypothetical protein
MDEATEVLVLVFEVLQLTVWLIKKLLKLG